MASAYVRPKAYEGWVATEGRRPFQMRDPALDEFPSKLWGQSVARRVRAFKSWLRTEDDGRGYRPLREAAAHYLGSSRGVRCGAEQVVIVSGVQQALDLLARLLLRQDDPVWVEGPAYVGATMAFTNAGAETAVPYRPSYLAVYLTAQVLAANQVDVEPHRAAV